MNKWALIAVVLPTVGILYFLVIVQPARERELWGHLNEQHEWMAAAIARSEAAAQQSVVQLHYEVQELRKQCEAIGGEK